MTMDNIACVKRVPAEWAQMELSSSTPFVELSLEERHQAAVGVYQDALLKQPLAQDEVPMPTRWSTCCKWYRNPLSCLYDFGQSSK